MTILPGPNVMRFMDFKTRVKYFFKFRRQYLIAPKGQLRFALYFIALGIISQTALSVGSYYYLRQSFQTTAQFFAVPAPAMYDFSSRLAGGLLIIGIWVGLMSVLLTAWLVLRFSHRFYGPCIPIERLLNELTEGRYGGQIRLRHDDELTGIKNALNALSVKLQNSK